MILIKNRMKMPTYILVCVGQKEGGRERGEKGTERERGEGKRARGRKIERKRGRGGERRSRRRIRRKRMESLKGREREKNYLKGIKEHNYQGR